MPDFTKERWVHSVTVSYCFFWGKVYGEIDPCEYLYFRRDANQACWTVQIGSVTLETGWKGIPSLAMAEQFVDRYVMAMTTPSQAGQIDYIEERVDTHEDL